MHKSKTNTNISLLTLGLRDFHFLDDYGSTLGYLHLHPFPGSSDILHSDHLSEHFLKDVLHFLHTAVTWYVRTEVAEPYGNSIYNLALFRISCVYNKQSLLNS